MPYYVYILANVTRKLYVGMTNNLGRRMHEHKHKLVPGFTSRYGITRLVYYEDTPNVIDALEREKQIKKWRRDKKIALIERENPEWQDLSEDWMCD